MEREEEMKERGARHAKGLQERAPSSAVVVTKHELLLYVYITAFWLQVHWVAGPAASLPKCPASRILEVYPESAFHLDDGGLDGDVIATSQLVTRYGREPAAYCLDHGIEDGSYLRLVALACLDPQLLCAADNSCLNSCCPQDVYCQLPPQLRAAGFLARPKQLDCGSQQGVNVTISEQVQLAYLVFVLLVLNNGTHGVLYCFCVQLLFFTDTVDRLGGR